MMLLMRTHVKFSELTLLVVSALIPTFQRFLVRSPTYMENYRLQSLPPDGGVSGAELSKKS